MPAQGASRNTGAPQVPGLWQRTCADLRPAGLPILRRHDAALGARYALERGAASTGGELQLRGETQEHGIAVECEPAVVLNAGCRASACLSAFRMLTLGVLRVLGGHIGWIGDRAAGGARRSGSVDDRDGGCD